MSMDELLKELKAEYVASIPEKINELTTYFEKKDYDNLVNSFHKLKGSGKTYGIEEITILGQFFEHWLREKKESVIGFTPKAIDFLKKIHESRLKEKPYNLDQDAEFLKLQSIR